MVKLVKLVNKVQVVALYIFIVGDAGVCAVELIGRLTGTQFQLRGLLHYHLHKWHRAIVQFYECTHCYLGSSAFIMTSQQAIWFLQSQMHMNSIG